MSDHRQYMKARHREWREHIAGVSSDSGDGFWESTPEARKALPGATYLSHSAISATLWDMEKLGMLIRVAKGKYKTNIPAMKEAVNV